MDVGWHTHNPGRNPNCQGYNGFDWDTSLFPDPEFPSDPAPSVVEFAVEVEVTVDVEFGDSLT